MKLCRVHGVELVEDLAGVPMCIRCRREPSSDTRVEPAIGYTVGAMQAGRKEVRAERWMQS